MAIQTRQFGKTGHQSSRVIFGAAGLGRVSQQQADRTLEILLEYGVNHIDVAASYGNGEAERRIGPWMGQHRGQFFLATKTGQRTCQGARDELHGSLERLRVDSVDLVQLHNLVDPAEREQALGPGGALEALLEAREQGLARFIGVTGHGYTVAETHLHSLDSYPFDSVLLPYNYVMMQDEGYAGSFAELEHRCVRHNVALQTIKSLARRPWQAGRPEGGTWYEPLEDEAAIMAAVSWVLGDPEVFLISTSDILLLPRVLEAARLAASRPADARMAELLRDQQMRPIFRGTKSIL